MGTQMITRRARRVQVGILTVGLLASFTAALAGPAASPASAAAPRLTAVRTIGGPGHAAHYGWGAEVIPPGQPRAGNVLISDYWNFRVTELDQQGNVVRHVIGKDPATHQAPYDVAVNPVNGNIAVGDVDSGGTVDIYTRDGVLLRQCGNLTLWKYPAYLDYDQSGRLAVADSRGNKVVVVDEATCAVRYSFGSSPVATNRVLNPRGIDFAPDGTLWVASNGNARAVRWQLGPTSATPVASFPLAGADYRGLLYNPDNNRLYVVDAALATVDVYDATTGASVDTFGGYGSGDGKFQDGGRGITRDGSGNIWVADMPAFRTQKFTPDGDFLQIAPVGAAPPPAGTYNQPQDVAVMGDGTVVGIDSFNWRVNVHPADGSPARAFGRRTLFNYPRGIAADRTEGTVLVMNTDSHELDKYTLDGRLLWAVDAKAWAVAVDQTDGRIYVAEGEANKITVLNRDGSFVRTIGQGQFFTPRGIAVDPVDRSVWVANWGNGKVVHLSADGTVLGTFLSGSKGAHGIEVDQDTVYVADKLGHVIRMFGKDGTPQGTFGAGGKTLGRFLGPAGLEIMEDPQGVEYLYVMESVNERIQVVRVTR